MRPPLFTPPSVDAKTRRRQTIRALLIFAAIFALVPLAYVIESWRGKLAWSAYEREAKQRSVKLTLAENLPPPVPDAENFANIPIVDAAFKASYADQPVPNPLALTADKKLAAKRPKFGDIARQPRIDLEAWRSFLLEAKLLEATSDNVAADVLRGLESVAEPLGQLREASRRPHSRFPVQWEKHIAARVPHTRILEDAAKVLSLRAAAHLALGDSAAAYTEFHDGVRMIRALRGEPSLISGLVRLSMTAALLNAVSGGLADGTWAEPELRLIESELAGFDWLVDYQFALESERRSHNATIDMFIHSPESWSDDEDKKTHFRYYPSGWFYQNKVRFNRHFDELIARVEPDRRRIFPDRPLRFSPSDIKSTAAKLYYVYFGMAAPTLESVDRRFIQVASWCDLARLACALERRRLVRGDFPERLAELVPDFMPALPVELVSGEPYRYRLEKAGDFALYSVALDLRDDGGLVDPELSIGKQKDWVWRAAQP